LDVGEVEVLEGHLQRQYPLRLAVTSAGQEWMAGLTFRTFLYIFDLLSLRI
jgi:hypothetical protein